jgi:plasmid maintenance system antidote protein VapI
MNKTKKTDNRLILFPDNRKIKDKLMRGDRATLAEYTGFTQGTVNEMMKGYRRFTPTMETAIIRLFDERKQRQDALEQIANQ